MGGLRELFLSVDFVDLSVDSWHHPDDGMAVMVILPHFFHHRRFCRQTVQDVIHAIPELVLLVHDL